jgi:hypothetical protein
MEIQMRLSDACPAGTATCNDVTAINLLLPLFPVAVVLAFLFAWPLNRFLPLRPLLGWSLAIIGGAVYLYFATGPSGGSLLGLLRQRDRHRTSAREGTDVDGRGHVYPDLP